MNAHRDQSPENRWPEIPAKTPYPASYGKPAVCEDWMVETVGLKLVTHHPVIEPLSTGNGISDRRDRGENAAYSPAETGDRDS